MLYTSTNNEYIKNLKKLETKKQRDLTNTFLVEGEHLVEEAIKHNYLKTLILLEGTNYKFDGEKIFVSEKVMKYLSSLVSTPKMIGVVNKLTKKELGNKIVVLDAIQDPGNLGTIIRSAVAFNIDTIVLSEDSVDLYNEKVIRATQGLLFNLNIITKDISLLIDELKELDYQILGTKVNGGKSLKNVENREKFAIIVGNEGQGVKEEILNKCDEYIYIKTNPNCESLNVSVALSIIIYELNGG